MIAEAAAPPRALVATSEHPVPAQAVAECAGDLLERGAVDADLLWVAAGPSFGGAMLDMVGTLRVLLDPGVTVAVTSNVVIGGSRVIDRGTGLCVLAVAGLTCTAVRIEGGVTAAAALAGAGLDEASTLVVMADPFSTRPHDLAGPSAGPAAVAGGLLAGGGVPGSNVLMLATDTSAALIEYRDGAVAVAVPPNPWVTTAVAHGHRPVGPVVAVTRVSGDVVHTLAARPAREVVDEALWLLGDEGLTEVREVGLCRLDRAPTGTALADVGTGAALVAVGDGPAPPTIRTAAILTAGERVQLMVRTTTDIRRDLGAIVDLGHGRKRAYLCFSDLRRLPPAVAADDDVTLLSERSPPLAGIGVSVEFGPARPSTAAMRGVTNLVAFG